MYIPQTRFLTLTVAAVLIATTTALAQPQSPWPADVPGYVPPEPGDHPRLLFREADIPALREKAKTPEGQAILKRLREQLDGGDGDTLNDPDRWTMSHVAGYGLLYVITGEQKYADLGRQAMEQSLAGAKRKEDTRYAFKGAEGALRAGPALGWHALGYDLCYDGWDPAFREKVRDALLNYNDGKSESLEQLVRGSRHGPHSNHWSMQIGGGAMALLALMNDPGVPRDRIDPLLKTSEQAFRRQLTDGFGESGYFQEGDGTGSMAHIVFLPAIQAWRVAGGKDFYTPRPNAQWISLRALLGTVVKENGEILFHKRDGYKHNMWTRDGISGGNYFGIAFGLAPPVQDAAWLWFYNRHLKQRDLDAGTPYDTLSYYPHHSILSFVNWPVDIEPVNPAECIPRAVVGRRFSYGMFRNRWQDENDIVITFLGQKPRKATKPHEVGPIRITAFGQESEWGGVTGKIEHFTAAADGSSIIKTSKGTCLAVDFSGTSGAAGMLVLTGPGAPDEQTVTAGDATFAFKFLTDGKPPVPRVEGGQVVIGEQTVSMKDGLIVLGRMAGPWDGPTDKARAAAAGR